MKPTPEMIEVACKAHTPQFDRMDPDLQVYARQQMSEALSAALSVPAAAVVGEPDGWKLVPIEPTVAMIKAADIAGAKAWHTGERMAAAILKAGITAAPSGPEGYVRGHLHLIRCFADDMTERNWEDKRLYIKQQVDFIVSALGGASHE